MNDNDYRQTMSEMKHFFDDRAENWDCFCGHNANKLSSIVTLAGIAPGFRIADIACGTGAMFSEMLSCNPSEITGIDLSSQMIEKARCKFTDSRIKLLVSDLFDFQESGFDLAMIYSAYPHFPDKRRLAQHVHHMLKDGGRIMIAHSEGKEKINGHHKGHEVSQISWSLRPAKEEAANFSDFFHIDILVDTPELYIISGIKTESIQ